MACLLQFRFNFLRNIPMAFHETFQQSTYIAAPLSLVDRTITSQVLMHRWLNPVLRCEPVGEWSTELGSKSQFVIQVPLLKPRLSCTVIQRQPGLIVWEFEGFFKGQDRWECHPESTGTRLLNRFEFKVDNPLIAYGFNTFAASWTRQDMQAQLLRLKQVAEQLAASEPTPTTSY